MSLDLLDEILQWGFSILAFLFLVFVFGVTVYQILKGIIDDRK